MNSLNNESINILIVDDNPQNLQILGNFLKSVGYRIEFALNGSSALEWIENKKFDLILLDVMMPGISGLDVCAEIRAKAEFDSVPIIFISADNDKGTILKGFEKGGQDYITKPFDHRELYARVKTQLDLKFSKEDLVRLNDNLENQVKERTAQLNEALTSLEKANAELGEIEKIKNDFLNIISHELRTPLNGILGPLELIRLKLDDPKILKLVDLLDQSVTRLEKFSYTALIITELRTKRRKLDLQTINLKEVIDAVVSQDNTHIQNKELIIQVEHEEKMLETQGDRHLVINCMQCLLDRMVRLSPHGDRILIRSSREQLKPVCELSSPSLSVPERFTSENPSLFEQELSYADNNPGLDFALAHLVMKENGGRLEIINQEGGGLIFRLIFEDSK